MSLNHREIMIHWIAHFKAFFAFAPFPMDTSEKKLIDTLNLYRKHYAISISFDEMVEMNNDAGKLLINDKKTMYWKAGLTI